MGRHSAPPRTVTDAVEAVAAVELQHARHAAPPADVSRPVAATPYLSRTPEVHRFVAAYGPEGPHSHRLRSLRRASTAPSPRRVAHRAPPSAAYPSAGTLGWTALAALVLWTMIAASGRGLRSATVWALSLGGLVPAAMGLLGLATAIQHRRGARASGPPPRERADRHE